MAKIKLTCDGCGLVHTVERTPEIPDNVISMGCNFCPFGDCEDKANDYYDEWYNESDDGETPEPTPDNQLMLFTEFDEVINTPVKIFNPCK